MGEFLSGALRRVRSGSPLMFIDQLPGEHSRTGVFDADGNHIQERVLPDGSAFRVIKHFFSDDQIAAQFSGFAGDLSIQRFPECRRLIVTFMPTKSEVVTHQPSKAGLQDIQPNLRRSAARLKSASPSIAEVVPASGTDGPE
jgi:hypothetical protein